MSLIWLDIFDGFWGGYLDFSWISGVKIPMMLLALISIVHGDVSAQFGPSSFFEVWIHGADDLYFVHISYLWKQNLKVHHPEKCHDVSSQGTSWHPFLVTELKNLIYSLLTFFSFNYNILSLTFKTDSSSFWTGLFFMALSLALVIGVLLFFSMGRHPADAIGAVLHG